MTTVKLPDGSLKEFDSAVSVKDVAKSIGSRLAKDALWGEIDLQPVELDYEIPQGEPVNLKIITKKDPNALETMRHSCAHVMARAGDAY
jgi:threonyl-tRNA synthetase